MVSVKIYYQILNSFLLTGRCSGKKPMKDMLEKKIPHKHHERRVIGALFQIQHVFFPYT